MSKTSSHVDRHSLREAVRSVLLHEASVNQGRTSVHNQIRYMRHSKRFINDGAGHIDTVKSLPSRTQEEHGYRQVDLSMYLKPFMTQCHRNQIDPDNCTHGLQGHWELFRYFCSCAVAVRLDPQNSPDGTKACCNDNKALEFKNHGRGHVGNN